MNINLAIADDHPMVISGLKNMLDNHPHIIITGTYQNGDELLDSLTKTIPDVLLLDIQMPGKTGDKLAYILQKKYPQIALLTLTNFDNVIYVNSMLRQGVSGYLLKTTDQYSLVKAIEVVAKGGRYIDPAIEENVKDLQLMEKEAQLNPLTLREKEILQHLINGETTKEIATNLSLSFYTVENYRARILDKLDARNMAELTRKALMLGLAK